MKALILSGGTGSRLKPVTYSIPKQLIPIANKPILYHVIEKVAEAGIKDIGIVVGDTHQQIKEAVGEGGMWHVNITYIYQPLPLGLAHAVKTASDFIGEDEFLMILGDNLFEMDLDDIIDNFYYSSASASILLHKADDPSQFGVAVINDGNITQLVEKPKEFISSFIITGIYIFNKNIFNAIERIKPSERGELEITDAIQNLIETGHKVGYELTAGWWKDTGKPHDILEANHLVLSGMEGCIQGLMHENSVLKGNIQTGRNVIISNSTIQGPVIIGDGSTITNSFINSFTSIGSNVKIDGCKIHNSIIMQGSELCNAGWDMKDCLIGRNVILRGARIDQSALRLILSDSCEIYF